MAEPAHIPLPRPFPDFLLILSVQFLQVGFPAGRVIASGRSLRDRQLAKKAEPNRLSLAFSPR